MPSPASPTILPDPTHLQLVRLGAEARCITATVRTTAASACCPLCGQASTRVHSRYTRRLASSGYRTGGAGDSSRFFGNYRRGLVDLAAVAPLHAPGPPLSG